VAAIVTAGTCIGFIFHPAAAPIGIAVILAVLTIWLWPTRDSKPLNEPLRQRTEPQMLSTTGTEV
jgi:hypothetical protein